MKRILVPAALVTGSLVVALVLGELLVRLLLKEQTVMFPRYHTEYRYGEYTLRGIQPNAQFWHTSPDGTWKFVTNSRGLRDTREFPYAKPPGVLRVLALGDSHTQGYEVRQEATYAAVLERYLASHGIRAEVLNAGVSGFSTAEAAAYLEAEGYRYEPDAVVLGFYANDFEDNLKAGLFALKGETLVVRKRRHLPGVRIQNVVYSIPGTKWLGENSYFYSVLFNTVWKHFKRASREQAKEEAALEFAVPMKSAHSNYEVALAAALIERMQRFCESRGMRFIVVDIPRRFGPYRFAESISPGLKVELVSSRELLANFHGAVEVHLPRGQTHISEFTHALIGAEVGKRILEKK